jgi:hemolysin activation/secretion protein
LHRSGFRLLAFCFLILLAAQASAATHCVTLVSVDIETSEVLSAIESRDLVEPYLGACIDAELTRELLAVISDHLIANGYVTSRPYLLEQDISDGQIEIRILPGIIEKIIDADSGRGSGKITTAFLSTPEILNLREIETALERIERVSSITANIEIRPGTVQGGSIVAVKTTELDPFRLELGANAQTELEDQLSLLLNWDNPLNINDILQIRLNDGELREQFQSNRSREFSYSFPLGPYLLALRHSEIEFKQRIQGSVGSFLSEGETDSDRFAISRIVARNQSNRVTLGLALELEHTDNFLEDEPIDVSSYRTTQLLIDLNHDWYQPWGQLGMNYSYRQGLDSFGARDDDYFTRNDGAENEARLQFEMFSIDGRMVYLLGSSDRYLDVNLHLQYSDDILFDGDKLNLGSPYTVRGYSSALSGSNAWYLHSDIRWQLQSTVNPLSETGLVKSITLSLGLDYGEVKCEVDNRDVCGEIYGAGLGLVVSDANFSGRFLWGRPLKKIGDGIGDEDRFLLDLRWGL